MSATVKRIEDGRWKPTLDHEVPGVNTKSTISWDRLEQLLKLAGDLKDGEFLSHINVQSREGIQITIEKV